MRRPLALLAALLLVLVPLVALGAGAAGASNPEPPSTGGYDLERPPSECIGLLQRPDCGREPIEAGDRGGALQWLTFGIILAALAVIFTVIFVNVIRADRAKAAAVAGADRDDESAVAPSGAPGPLE